jgi:hypothetical protein
MFISIFSYGQKMQKKTKRMHHLQMIDSCQILKQILSTKLVYHKQGNYYHDNTGLFYIYHFDSYPSFKRCILNKDTLAIKKMFGKPSRGSEGGEGSFAYTYCLLPNDDVTCCYKYFMIVFDRNGIVNDMKGGGCIRDND